MTWIHTPTLVRIGRSQSLTGGTNRIHLRLHTCLQQFSQRTLLTLKYVHVNPLHLHSCSHEQDAGCSGVSWWHSYDICANRQTHVTSLGARLPQLTGQAETFYYASPLLFCQGSGLYCLLHDLLQLKYFLRAHASHFLLLTFEMWCYHRLTRTRGLRK